MGPTVQCPIKSSMWKVATEWLPVQIQVHLPLVLLPGVSGEAARGPDALWPAKAGDLCGHPWNHREPQAAGAWLSLQRGHEVVHRQIRSHIRGFRPNKTWCGYWAGDSIQATQRARGSDSHHSEQGRLHRHAGADARLRRPLLEFATTYQCDRTSASLHWILLEQTIQAKHQPWLVPPRGDLVAAWPAWDHIQPVGEQSGLHQAACRSSPYSRSHGKPVSEGLQRTEVVLQWQWRLACKHRWKPWEVPHFPVDTLGTFCQQVWPARSCNLQGVFPCECSQYVQACNVSLLTAGRLSYG